MSLIGVPRKPSFAPSSTITIFGSELFQCLGDALLAAGGGLAADAGVHDAEAGLRALQFLPQQIDPTFVYLEAVAG